MNFETLISKRLTLIKINQDVLQYVFENYNAEEQSIFFGLKSDIELEKKVERYRKGFSTFNKSFLYFHLQEKASGEIIGTCGYHTWYIDHHRAEIFYMLNEEEYKAKGFVSEVLPLIIDYGFTTMKLHRIEAFVGPNNIPSLKLMKKFHFIQEGQLREHYFKDGKMEDSMVFSLLKQEYIST